MPQQLVLLFPPHLVCFPSPLFRLRLRRCAVRTITHPIIIPTPQSPKRRRRTGRRIAHSRNFGKRRKMGEEVGRRGCGDEKGGAEGRDDGEGVVGGRYRSEGTVEKAETVSLGLNKKKGVGEEAERTVRSVQRV
jgi:hypothetical protein